MSRVWTVVRGGLRVVVLTATVELVGLLVRRLRSKGPLNEVLFFPSETACTEHIFTSHCSGSCLLPHGVETSFSRLLRHLLSASSTLDLCLFSFSNFELCRAVLALHTRGLVVRVLTDKVYAAITGSQIGLLRKAGICVRCDSGSVHMHHKFSVVDGRRLITGSLNWTLTAVQSNRENLVVTEEPDLVAPFVREFQRLWEANDPARHCPPGIAH